MEIQTLNWKVCDSHLESSHGIHVEIIEINYEFKKCGAEITSNCISA
jgi:hypothetical protein